MFTIFLKYKLEDMAKRFVKVNRFLESFKICSDCGCKNSEVRNLEVRSWSCSDCGKYHDRDTNTAINIRNEGMRVVNVLV